MKNKSMSPICKISQTFSKAIKTNHLKISKETKINKMGTTKQFWTLIEFYDYFNFSNVILSIIIG